ncbi:MAG: class I SAM-dependent methyltransferase [Kofleriaceae bacterium]
MLRAFLDRRLYRRPFEGRSATRYATSERPAFGDFDDRLLDSLAGPIERSRTFLDVGAGPAVVSRRAAERWPNLAVIAVEPSRDFAIDHPSIQVVRAFAEDLPLADGSIDVAVCLSSIRHVRDRAATFRELRRVATGKLVIVELDPTASAARIANHANAIAGPLLRAAFGPLVVRTAPPVEAIESVAIAAGWHREVLRDDPVQPVYILELV